MKSDIQQNSMHYMRKFMVLDAMMAKMTLQWLFNHSS